MNPPSVLAWVAAGVTALAVAGLVVWRSLPFARADSQYRLLNRATLVATALLVGALAGLGVFSIVSGGGR